MYNPLTRVIILGDANVGKSFIYNKMLGKSFDDVLPKIGINHDIVKVSFRDGLSLRSKTIDVWDTAGQEKFNFIVSMYFRKSRSAILVFDLTKELSFRSVSNLLTLFDAKNDEDCHLFLIGNKLDLVEENPNSRRVSNEEATKFAANNQMKYFETSIFLNQ